MSEVLDLCVGPWEEQALVAVITPSDQPGRRTIFAVHLQHLAVLVGGTNVVSLDDQPITDCCAHQTLLRSHHPESNTMLTGNDRVHRHSREEPLVVDLDLE